MYCVFLLGALFTVLYTVINISALVDFCRSGICGLCVLSCCYFVFCIMHAHNIIHQCHVSYMLLRLQRKETCSELCTTSASSSEKQFECSVLSILSGTACADIFVYIIHLHRLIK